MKILRVIASMDPSSGGPCQGIRNSIPELKKLGVHNEVVCLDAVDASFLGKDGFVIHAIGPSKGPWQYADTLIPFLIENLIRFDVVIVHGLWLYHGYATRKAWQSLARKNNVKLPDIFVMPHGMLDPYFQKAEGRKLKAIRNEIYWRLIENKLIRIAKGVLFTCEAELLLARQSFKPYNPSREINVGYGISRPPAVSQDKLNAFKEKCTGLNDSPYLLFLSRIHEKKGVDLLLSAYIDLFKKNCHDKIPEAAFHDNFPKLVIAGPGLDSLYGQSLFKKIEEHPEVSGFVYFPGMLSGDAKWGAFYGCEAFILPSHQENFGIAVVEALACGKPVLISDQVNIWKEIEQSGAGIVNRNTLEGTQQLLKNYFNQSDSLKSEMKSKAINCYEKYFTNSAAAKKVCQYLNAGSAMN